MNATSETSELRYVEPACAEIAGEPCEGMTIRAATGRALGHVQGFIIDPEARRLRYVVVRSSEPRDDVRLLPIAGARVSLPERAIELLDDSVLDEHS